jgi:hypothetical protein
MSLRHKITGYFKKTDKEKNEVLLEIVHMYKNENFFKYNNSMNIEDMIETDIETYTNEDEYEMVQALTDIKNAINDVKKEIRDGL